MRGRLQPKEPGSPVIARRGAQVYEMRPAATREAEEGRGAPDYIADWLYYLVRFTAPQFLRWQQIVAKRTDRAVLSEAVDVVMREAAQNSSGRTAT